MNSIPGLLFATLAHLARQSDMALELQLTVSNAQRGGTPINRPAQAAVRVDQVLSQTPRGTAYVPNAVQALMQWRWQLFDAHFVVQGGSRKKALNSAVSVRLERIPVQQECPGAPCALES